MIRIAICDDEIQIVSELQDKIRTKDCAPDINIAYFENKNQGEKECR